MKYLVVSEDALKGRIRTSEHFPCVVDMGSERFIHTPDEIMEECFLNTTGEEFRPAMNKKYIIIPIHNDARRVTFRKPVPTYTTVAEPWYG